MDTIVSQLSSIEFRSPEKTAVVTTDGLSISYSKLLKTTTDLATALSATGIERGSVVAIALPNCLELVIAFVTLAGNGFCAMVLNPDMGEDEYDYALSHSQACAIIVGNPDAASKAAADRNGIPSFILMLDFVPNSAPKTRTPLGSPISCSVESAAPDSPASAIDRSVESAALSLVESASRAATPRKMPSSLDAALLMYTSGTTNRPKGVPLTERNLLASARNFIACFRLTEEDVAYNVMPLFHIHGLAGITLSTLLSGGTVLLAPRFSASQFWEPAIKYGATWISAAPTIHRILLQRADADHAPRSLFRFMRASSAPMGAEEIEAIETRFESPFLSAYGLTEAANQVSANPLPPLRRKHHTVGLPQGVAVAILDAEGNELSTGQTGEIAIKGDNVMAGYLHNPEANAACFTSGWFRTGDQGFIDEDGYLTVNGRIKDLIIRGGENISPAEVELILMHHPQVTEAVCFGLPDATHGEEIYAAVVSKSTISSLDLINYCGKHVSKFKVPKKIFFLDRLPRNALNKVLRQQVAETCRQYQ
ncbi:MAG TPA: AMP-binding protein [Candidatus Obscuribacterales bacterium]